VKIALGTITANDFPAPNLFWEAFIMLKQRLDSGEANQHLPAHLQIDSTTWFKSHQFPTDCGRNEICAGALKGGYDYLLFLDCDMVHPSDLVERLLVMEQPIATGVYHIKRPPFAACVFMEDQVDPRPHIYRTVHFGRGVFEVHACGAGALLIHRSVLQAIFDRHGYNWFRYQRGPDAPHDFSVSEDMWFCEQARAEGFSIWCDWELRCGHITPQIVGKSSNDNYLLAQMQMLVDQPPAQRVDVIKRMVVRGIPEGIDLPSGEHVDAYVAAPRRPLVER